MLPFVTGAACETAAMEEATTKRERQLILFCNVKNKARSAHRACCRRSLFTVKEKKSKYMFLQQREGKQLLLCLEKVKLSVD